jgi:4,5-dihydroxyphthalate decarboxylase
MKFAVLRRPRTQAILDGRVKLDALPIDWHPITEPLNWLPPSRERQHGILSGQFDGGEMSISSFMQAKAQGAPLLALPIFLKRGLVQRCLFCSVDSPLTSPAQLTGKRVGLVGYSSSMAVWVRGILSEVYGLFRSAPLWFTLTAPSQKAQVTTKLLEIPEEFSGEQMQAWEELDGYPHNLDRREGFLFSLLEKGELNAVVSFHPKIASPRIRPLLGSEDELWSHYQNKGIYPINHLFVLRRDILGEFANISKTLLSTFKQARKLWVDYLPNAKSKAMDDELETLGWDPFAYRLGEVEQRTLETFIAYLAEEKMILQKLSVDELFHKDSLLP